MGRVTAAAGKVNRLISQSVSPSLISGADQLFLSLCRSCRQLQEVQNLQATQKRELEEMYGRLGLAPPPSLVPPSAMLNPRQRRLSKTNCYPAASRGSLQRPHLPPPTGESRNVRDQSMSVLIDWLYPSQTLLKLLNLVSLSEQQGAIVGRKA